MKDLEKSVAEEIADVSIGRPHVVLLGAVASPARRRWLRVRPTATGFIQVSLIKSHTDQ